MKKTAPAFFIDGPGEMQILLAIAGATKCEAVRKGDIIWCSTISELFLKSPIDFFPT